MAATYISGNLPRIFSRKSASRFSSMALSSLSLTRRNWTISPLVELKDISYFSHPPSRVSISVGIYSLPVTNIWAPGDFSKISPNESKKPKSLHGYTLVERVNNHKYMLWGRDELYYFHDLTKLRFASTNGLSLLSQGRWYFLRNPSIPLIACLSNEPSILVVICSFRAAKLK